MKFNLSLVSKAALLLSCSASFSSYAALIEGTDLHSSVGRDAAINDLFSGNQGSNGGGDQSLQFGDNLTGTNEDDVIIGGLGIDVIFGKDGDDIIIGGTEDFNPANRDRAFGNGGDDVFIWAPGDGNDFFDGGAGNDVLVIGIIGEKSGPNGNELGLPEFNINPPGTEGSQDFDGIILQDNGFPFLKQAPGFCEVLDQNSIALDESEQSLSDLNLDHLVQFSLTNVADQFDAEQSLDTGLRVSIHLKNTEFVVCHQREEDALDIFDLRTSPVTKASVDQLPAKAIILVD